MNKKVVIAFVVAIIVIIAIILIIPFPAKDRTISFSYIDGTIAELKIKDGELISELEAPEIEGYTFIGWTVNGEFFDFTTPVNGDMTLVANYEKNNDRIDSDETDIKEEFIVAFDTDGGSIVSTQIVTKGETVTKPEDPTKLGYKFIVWTLNETEYNFETAINSNITLKANWEKVESALTVTFDTDGGNSISKQTVEKGKTATKPNDPIKSGYTFKGWILNGKTYDFKSEVNEDITLKANWEKILQPVTVTFDTDGGSSIVSQVVEKGENVDKPSNPTRSGYTFIEWLLNGKAYDFRSKVNENITLKASWKKIEYVTVTFDTDGGSLISTQTIAKGKVVARPSNPTKEDYAFTGWTLNGEAYDFGTAVNSNITLKANWEKISQPVTVTFDTDGGSSVVSQNLEKGFKAERPNNPTKSGYTFVAWLLNGKEYDFNAAVNENITLKASWKKIEYVTVTFDTDGGSKVATQTIVKGRLVAKPSNPTKEDYAFTGWTLNGKTYDFGTAVNSNITLKANWKKISQPVTVTFDTDGGSSVKSQTIDQGGKISKPSNPVKSGYTFVAWLLNGKEYDFNAAVNSNITLKASWKKSEYTVIFNTDGGNAITAQKVEKGKTVTRPADPKRSEFVFVGWTLNGNSYNFSTAVNSNMTLKANWVMLGDINEDENINGRDISALASHAYYKSKLLSDRQLLFADVNQDGTVDEVDYSIMLAYGTGAISKLPYNSGSKYTITYNLNGGTMEPSFSVYSQISLPYELKQPVKSGYNFLGWTGSNGSTPQKNVTIPTGKTGNLTYTANWERIKYTVTFDTDGGSSVKAQTVEEGGKATKPANPTKTDYIFTGWTISGTTTAYNFTEAVNANITLKANWKKVTYTVTFNTDGGSSVKAQTVEKGSKATKPTNPTKTDYAFMGWTISGTTTAYNFTETVNANVTLKANWAMYADFDDDGEVTMTDYTELLGCLQNSTTLSGKKLTIADVNQDGVFDAVDLFVVYGKITGDIKSLPYNSGSKYTITYNLNGGKLNTSYMNVYSAICLPYTLETPTRSGYEFVGWTGSNGSTPQKNVTIPTGKTGNLTYTANWKLPTYTVTFNTDGGSSVKAQTVEKGSKATKPTNPTKENYVLISWNLNGKAYSFDTAVTSNITLVADWALKMDVNVDGVVDSHDIILLKKYITNNGLSSFTDKQKIIADVNEDGVIDNDDITYMKQYIVNLQVFTVRFNSNGGSSVASQSGVTGVDTVVKPEDPTRAGYVFDGWYLGTVAYVFGSDVTESITLTAKWILLMDVNGDGDINSHDTILLRKYLDGTMTLDRDQLIAADCNQDGVVDTDDLNAIKKYIANYQSQN